MSIKAMGKGFEVKMVYPKPSAKTPALHLRSGLSTTNVLNGFAVPVP